MQMGYPAARRVAPTVVEHLAVHAAAARARGYDRLGACPDADTIEALVDAAFWASLQREEGRSPKISLAYVSPEVAGTPMRFERGLALNPRDLARLAPAVERAGIHLGVWPDDGILRVWGTTRSVPTVTLVLEVVDPGLLVVKYRRADELDRFGTVAVVEGERISVVDETSGASLPDCPALVSSLLGFEAPTAAAGSANVLIQLAVSMRAHHHGGSLIVVPERGGAWRESAAEPIPYRLHAYDELPRLLRAGAAEQATPDWRDALTHAVDAVAGLTAVDGATVLDERHALLAFGVKLVRRRGHDPVERVAVTAPVVGFEPRVVDPSRLGGTRHLSAAQFVHDQHDALAMVASQDGRFTVFAWSPCEEMVHAHRIETLLM
jgi:hypothetical protein